MIWEVDGVEYNESEVIPVPIILLDMKVNAMKSVVKKNGNDSDFINGYECALQQFVEFASRMKDVSRIE